MRTTGIVIALLVAGCGSTAVTAKPAPRPAPAPSSATTVSAAPADPQGAADGRRLSYGLAHAEQWDDLPRDAMPRMRSWTPDAVIGNRVTRAKIAFASVPASFGEPLAVAEGVRDGMKVAAAVVMGSADGARAAFLFVTKDGRHGKVAVLKVPGFGSQYALVVGEWPAAADAASLEDFDEATKSLAVETVR